MRGHSDRFGSPCAGLIPPTADCAAQSVRDDARVVAGSVGGLLPIVHAHRIRLALIADVTLARFHVETRRVSGGDALVADKVQIGASLGAEAVWYPTPRLPFAIETSMAFAAFRPVLSEQLLDGYTPFEGGLSARRFRAGLAWRIH
jgi:hypothetical protein